jgi:hypothetical protein
MEREAAGRGGSRTGLEREDAHKVARIADDRHADTLPLSLRQGGGP